MGPRRDEEWTLRTLHAHFTALLNEQNLRHQQRYDAQTKALDAALLAAERAVQCVSMDTPILCADLLWRPAGDLLVGDELIAFDEEAPDGRGQRGSRGRLYRRAVVTGNSSHRDALLLINTPKGSVRCNYAHPWLSRRFRGNRWQWVRADSLKPGDEVMHAIDVWENDRSWEAGWLAGMFDGEGCLCFKNGTNGKARLSIVQRESETAEMIERLLKTRVTALGIRHRPGVKPTHSPKVEFEINVRAEVMKILGSVRPARLLVNANKVWEDFPIGGANRTVTISSIESAGTGMIASLSTSTGTYLAAGFAVHNTALTAAEKAVTKAEVAAEKRFDAVNEFRGAYQDIIALQMPRAEAEQRLSAMAEKIDDLKESSTERKAGIAGRDKSWAFLISAVGLALTLLLIYNLLKQ